MVEDLLEFRLLLFRPYLADVIHFDTGERRISAPSCAVRSIDVKADLGSPRWCSPESGEEFEELCSEQISSIIYVCTYDINYIRSVPLIVLFKPQILAHNAVKLAWRSRSKPF